jgi:tetratricopeptide (TPR) repeat protein
MSDFPDSPSPQAPAGDRQFISVQDAIARATRLFNAGRLRETENLTRQIIKARPRIADAHNILAVTLHRMGRSQEGLDEMRIASQLDPSNTSIFANLGEMERKAGNLDEAEAALKRATALDARSVQAHNNLGIVYYDRKDFEKARECYRAALRYNEQYAEAHNNLGNALRALDDIEGAISEYERAIELKENYAEAYNNMGTALRDQQKFDDAELAYRRAVTLKPDYSEAGNNLANLLVFQKNEEEALRVLGDLLKLLPEDVPTLITVARTQSHRGAYDLAQRASEIALEKKPDSVEAMCVQGQIFHELDRYDDAIKAFERALAIDPDSIEALNMLGTTYKSVGRMEDARKQFMRALELQPKAIGAYSNIVDLEDFTKDHPLFTAMTEILEQAKDPKEERYMALHFALGKAYDDAKEYRKALDHFQTGARLKRAQLDYDEAETFAFFDSIRATFDEAYFANKPYDGIPTSLPIFIVGMPRSGSTLTEQIIASHPDVFGAGEIKTLSMQMGLLRQRFPNIPKFPGMVKSMKPQNWAAIADGYLQTISALSSSAVRITDKLLTNYYFVGLINTLFPEAKIIHTMRHPVDTCLSSYTKLFKDDMPHSYDLAELGRYYLKYAELMEHWRGVLPKGVMLDVRYEDVVANKEEKAREIIAFCGLSWDERCLNFHETDRPVKTASVSQVRKPIYTTSLERWRRYGDALSPLVESLRGGLPGSSVKVDL